MASQKNTLRSLFVFFGVLVISELGFSSVCPNNIASTTTYFIPKMSDYCKGNTPCPRFRKQVRMQGSGIMPGNKVLTYNGKVRKMGSCSTSLGASGTCLIPYISVAADPRYYSMGDIIQMPSLKGLKVTLPDGSTMIHPGYLVVQDTGGAIRGRNRFDFFTGSMSYKNPHNTFGIHGSSLAHFSDKTDCDRDKQFSVVRRGSMNYQNSLLAIEDSLRSSGNARQVASLSKYSTGTR